MPATHPASHTPAERARDYLEARPAEHTSLDELAAAVGVSKFHLVRIFRRRFGVPPHAYGMQLRLRYARALLLEGRTIREASDAAGFADVSHLTREFKRAFGVTPGRFRKDIVAPETPVGAAGWRRPAGVPAK
jgi:AraC-like DNA-binding protein